MCVRYIQYGKLFDPPPVRWTGVIDHVGSSTCTGKCLFLVAFVLLLLLLRSKPFILQPVTIHVNG